MTKDFGSTAAVSDLSGDYRATEPICPNLMRSLHDRRNRGARSSAARTGSRSVRPAVDLNSRLTSR
jgi:hypothetical protein